jgi:hypothetical protein
MQGFRQGRDRHGGFPLAIDLHELGAEEVQSAFEILDIHGATAVDQRLEAGGVYAGSRGMADQTSHHGWCKEARDTLVRRHQLSQLVKVKAPTHRDDLIGCLGHMRQAVQARAV